MRDGWTNEKREKTNEHLDWRQNEMETEVGKRKASDWTVLSFALKIQW